MNKLGRIACSAALLLSPYFAQATVLDFENLSPGEIENGYGGLAWDNWGLMPKSTCQYGYCNSVTSGGWSAYNFSGENATISSATTFDFYGVNLTAAFHDNLSVNVKGYQSGQLTHNQTVGVTTLDARWFDFDFIGIDTLVFSAFGPDVNNQDSARGSNFAIDDFSFRHSAASVPEPSSFLIMAAGMALLAGFRRQAGQH